MSITKIYTLNKPQRAAAILVAMGKERASVILKEFKSEELRAMIDAAHTLQSIPQPDLEQLVQEFETEFTTGVGLFDSTDKMQNILSDFMTDEELNRFITPKKPVTAAEPETVDAWALISSAETPRVLDFLNRQSAQLAAIILQRLAPKKAASLIEELDEAKREPIMARMLSSRAVPDRVITAIEESLKEEFKADPNVSGGREAAAKIAEILNEMSAEAADKVLAQMTEKLGAKKIALVKTMLFRFEDIVLLDMPARSRLCDGLPSDLITNALRGADAELSEAILSGIGQRSRRMIEAELQGPSTVSQDNIKQARKSIASLALKMASEGQIDLPAK